MSCASLNYPISPVSGLLLVLTSRTSCRIHNTFQLNIKDINAKRATCKPECEVSSKAGPPFSLVMEVHKSFQTEKYIF